jgi:hypothetical protein
MPQYNAVQLPDSICAFKKSETRKYRDAVCTMFRFKFQPIAGDGNCFFAAVSTAMAHFNEDAVVIPATDLRTRVVTWLVDSKVCTPHLTPYTTLHHLTPPYTTLHHLTPPYTTLLKDGKHKKHKEVAKECKKSMLDELSFDVVRSVGTKGATTLHKVYTVDDYLKESAVDRTWVQGTVLHTPPYTTANYLTL